MSTFVIKLSKTSKMPCQSFSLPAQSCKTGGKLAKVKGSVCNGCYALKGFYNIPTVKEPRQANLASLPANDAGWLDWGLTMAKQIKGEYFRWHDSGDIQSFAHLAAIVYIAECKPETKFWLPTKERGIVSKYLKQHGHFPDNLIVRVSSAMIDQGPNPVKGNVHTSTVHTDADNVVGHICNAPSQGGKCKDCRACWDSSIVNISYAKH
jgi:hypothetical protein